VSIISTVVGTNCSFVGDLQTFRARIADCFEKKGRDLLFLVRETAVTRGRDAIARLRNTAILRTAT